MKIKILELREYMLYENELLYQMLQEIPAKDEFGQTNEYYGKSKPEIAEEINSRMKVAYSLVRSRNVLPAEILYCMLMINLFALEVLGLN